MADFGTTAGIGTGIGEAMREIGAGLAERGRRNTEARDKQAEAVGKQAQDIAAKIAQMGGPTAAGVEPYMQQLHQTVTQITALYHPHETPHFIQFVQRMFGGPPGPPRQDPRAQNTAEGMVAAAPRTPGG